MNVVLIGYRGTGKSTVAKLLAERLGLEAVSTDRLIEERIGTSIAAFVAGHGWPEFRAVEAKVVREVAARDHLVIDTGGGAVLDPASASALRRNARVFWLTASPATIVTRIGGDAARPPLAPGLTLEDEIVRVLGEREPIYRALADHVLQSETLSPAEVADRIVAQLGQAHT
ncbi:MAG: shikimate kinase [bacterium]